MEPKSLEDLEKYITILIVDDDDDVRKMLSEAFKKAGYETVWAVETADEAYQYLEFTNILFADYSLPNGQNGIELAIEAKEKYGERIQTVIFSGELEYFDKIQAESKKAKVAACIPKPIQPTYLQLWIKELGKRIWMQQIINNDPDEVLIRSENGTILYVDKQKEIIFGNNLIGDKCYLRFEEGYPINQLCERCPSRWSFNECSELEKSSIVRTEWDYITRGDINKHKIHQKNQSVELVTAPLLDIQKKPRAIIEIARDITIRKTAENIIGNMEAESTWENRKKLFMDGFDKLGITRSRLYLYYEKDKRKIYRMIDNRGKYDPPIQLPVDFDFGSDEPTRLILSNKQPLVFRRDENNDNRPYEKDKAIHNLYWVGKNNINHYEEFHKQYYNEWIDIPLIAHENIIGKVTIDGWKTKDCPDNYDIAILGRYCKSAGQIMYNARVRRDIEQRRKT
jgi:CheY-like chemotaxis protein